MARPKKPLISREGAIRAALEVIDDKGLDAFNLGLVAKRMGVAAPSLYHHFRDRNEVLVEVARLLLMEANEPMPPPATDDWRDEHVRLSIVARRALLRHPKAAPLVLIYPPRHLLLGFYERAMRLLEQRGVPQDLHLNIIDGLENITFGSALLAASARAHGVGSFPAYDPSSYPNVSAALDTNSLDDEQMFVRTCRSFLAGLHPANTRG